MKIGIDIGGSHITVGLIDNEYNILKLMQADIKSKKISEIEDYIIKVVKELMEENKIEEIGIALAGVVENGIIVNAVNLGLEQYNLAESLNKQLDIPIKICNDVKAAAIAEKRQGCLKEYNKSVFLTLGTGIGAAILNETENIEACEAGHIVIETDGIMCNCGRKGCWEKYASMKAFKENLNKDLGCEQKLSSNEILEMLLKNKNSKEKNDIIEYNIQKYIEYLSIGIVNLINIYKPEAIGIGGSFIYFEEIFLERLKAKVKEKNMLFKHKKNIEIKIAKLGNNAGMMGVI